MPTEQHKHPGGRPTLMTPDTVKKLEEAFANGASDVEACFLAGISKQTLYSYQELHPEFADRKAGLKDMTKYQAKLVVKEKIMAKDINTSTWYLENKASDEFNKKSTHELSGKDGGAIDQSITISFLDAKKE